MHAGNQTRFAIAIHMLQKSNPAGRQVLENRRGATRRHLASKKPREEVSGTLGQQTRTR